MGAASKGLLAAGVATLAVATVNLGWLDLALAPRALGAALIEPPPPRPAPGPQPAELPPAPEPERGPSPAARPRPEPNREAVQGRGSPERQSGKRLGTEANPELDVLGEQEALALQTEAPSSSGDGPCDASAEVSRQVHFASASAVLDEQATSRVEALMRHPSVQDDLSEVVIEGHADRRGDPERNEKLALERARAVAARLRALGLAAPIELRYFGARRPIAPPSDRWRNRRALICFMKETGS